MTTRKRVAASAAPKSAGVYKPDAFYQVQLSRPVPLPGGRQLIPVHGQRIKGSFLETLPADAIVSAVEHVPPARDQVGG